MRLGEWAWAAGTRRGLVTLSVLLLVGCMPSYRYGNVKYDSPEAALVAVRADADRFIQNVPEADLKVGGSLLVVAPTHEGIRRYGVVTKSSANQAAVDYAVELLEVAFVGWGDVVKAGKVFNEVTTIRADNAETYPADGYDFKLWLYVRSNGRWQWYLTKPGTSGLKPISAEKNLPPAHRAASFNTAVAKAARALGGSIARNSPAGNGGDSSSIGTGFFVNDAGFALSAAHVVDGCATIHAVLQDGYSEIAWVVAMDTGNDLAVLKLSMPSPNHARLRIGTPVRQGEPIIVYGYPLADALASKGNLSTGTVSALAGLHDDTRMLQISAPVQPGNSGGPALDLSGNVIGVVASKLNAIKMAMRTGDIPQNVNFAIKAGVVTTFLEANGVEFEPTTTTKTLTAADIGDQAKAFTFMVQCR